MKYFACLFAIASVASSFAVGHGDMAPTGTGAVDSVEISEMPQLRTEHKAPELDALKKSASTWDQKRLAEALGEELLTATRVCSKQAVAIPAFFVFDSLPILGFASLAAARVQVPTQLQEEVRKSPAIGVAKSGGGVMSLGGAGLSLVAQGYFSFEGWVTGRPYNQTHWLKSAESQAASGYAATIAMTKALANEKGECRKAIEKSAVYWGVGLEKFGPKAPKAKK